MIALITIIVLVLVLNYLIGWYCEKIERDEIEQNDGDRIDD